MTIIRQFTVADIPYGMQLKSDVGWNQTEADWHRFVALSPDGCFVAEIDGRPVGTVMTCTFVRVAWIAMMLVDKQFRRQGIGGQLMRHALDYLDQRQIPSIRLDATAQGEPLYESLGFYRQFVVYRYEGVPNFAHEDNPLTAFDWSYFDDVVSLDEQFIGTNRQHMLRMLFVENVSDTWLHIVDQKVEGYVTSRPGSDAIQLGPCMSSSADSGTPLLVNALNANARKTIYVDIPAQNNPATRIALEAGLSNQRELVRMCRGAPSCEAIESLWASSGPEKG